MVEACGDGWQLWQSLKYFLTFDMTRIIRRHNSGSGDRMRTNMIGSTEWSNISTPIMGQVSLFLDY